MSKMIAVYGSPCCGKTTASLKLAKAIYEIGKKTVIYLSPDVSIPTLGYIFPNSKDGELYSLGAVLDKTDIYKDDVIRQFVNTKTMKNFAFLGYKLCENRFSYPEPTEDKVNQLFKALEELSAYVIVDCTCDDNDLISLIAKRQCDVAVQIINPDIRSITYYASAGDAFLSVRDKSIKVLNLLDKDIYLPIEEVKKQFGTGKIILPYSRALKQQMITGKLSESLHDAAYAKQLGALVKEVEAWKTE